MYFVTESVNTTCVISLEMQNTVLGKEVICYSTHNLNILFILNSKVMAVYSSCLEGTGWSWLLVIKTC